MKCVRCSAEIPAQSQFCLRCGAAISNTAVNPTGYTAQMSMAQPRANNRPLLIAVALLAVLALGLGAYVAKGMLQKPGQASTGQLVQAPGQGNTGALVQTPGEGEPSPVMQAPGEPEPAAPRPADIEDYLAFVKRIEAEKQVLIRKQIKGALAALTNAQAARATADEDEFTQRIQNITSAYNPDEWEGLTRAFNERTPPSSCVDLRNKYLDQLARIQAMIVEADEAFSKIQTNPSGALDTLTQMQGRASGEADEAIAKADEALAEVCDRYRIRKDFDIKGDSASASMFR
jgi:hypothetical protein